MNENMKQAFEHIAHGRESLNAIIEEEPGFHSPTWQQAFTSTFDQLESLKNASPRDAAVLGSILITQVGNLIDALCEEEDNELSLMNLCAMTFDSGGYGLREASRSFEYVRDDLQDAHTPLTLTLLQQHGCGQECIVYGSYVPILEPKADLPNATFIAVDPASTGYETYIVVPTRLDTEIFVKYSLDLVSRPFDQPEE